MSSGENIDLDERLVVAHKVERLFGREDDVQTLRELLKKADKLKTKVFWPDPI